MSKYFQRPTIYKRLDMEGSKWCYACKEWLSLESFGKNRSKKDGLASECKQCKKIQDVISHEKHRAERLKKMIEYWEKNREELNRKGREYARSERGRAVNIIATKKYYDNNREKCLEKIKLRNTLNPEKYKAEYQLMNAVKLGHIVRPDQCQECNTASPVDGHHSDYSKPFDVGWLCKKCHGKIHRKRN